MSFALLKVVMIPGFSATKIATAKLVDDTLLSNGSQSVFELLCDPGRFI